jgi:parallel beta-helix repeat protein
VTISAWLKLNATNANQHIVALDNTTYARYGIWFYVADYNRLNVGYGDGGVKDAGHRRSKVGITELSADTWYHVSVVIKGPVDMDIYVDGSDDGGTYSGSGGDLVYSDGNSFIAEGDQSIDFHFNGMIDEVRIYSRALSAEEIEQIYQSATPVNYYYVDGVGGDDLNDGLTPETAFETIQEGVDEANDADTVLVYPALYTDPVDFDGKAITVRGLVTEAGVPTVETPMDYAFSFLDNEEPNSVLTNFVVRNSFLAALIIDAAPTLSNLTVVDNRFGIEAYAGAQPDITNCIFYNNTNGDLSGCDAQYSFVQDPVTVGLVGYWQFDEGQGTTAYDSAGTNHGTLINGPAWTTGVLEGALSFDGVDDYVEVPDHASQQINTDQITLTGWVTLAADVADTQKRIISKQQTVYIAWGLEIFGDGYGGSTGNQLVFHDSDGGTSAHNCVSPKHLGIGEWYHTAVTDDAGVKRIYLNGLLDKSSDEGYGIPENINAPIIIGSGGPSSAFAFEGTIDDLRLYDRALSAEEVRQVYREGLGPLFVDPCNGDYHLKSEGWSWSRSGWTWDEATSPCIDSGNPGTPLRDEPMSIPRDPDNIYGVNIRVNMGVYGGTSQASMPPHGWALLADLNNDGIVGIADLAGQGEDWVSSARERPGDLNRNGVVNMADFALLAEEWGEMTTWADMVNFSEYWPFAVGNQWDSEVIPDAGFTLDITDRFFVNGFEIWEFTNWFGTFYGGEIVTSYYVYVGGMLYATDSLLDLDSLPEISPGLRPQYPQVVPVGGVVSIRGIGMTTVRRGDLTSVLEGTGFVVEDFPLGYQSDVIAFISLDGEHVIVFARGLGPMRINFSNDFCSSEFFIASATVVE